MIATLRSIIARALIRLSAERALLVLWSRQIAELFELWNTLRRQILDLWAAIADVAARLSLVLAGHARLCIEIPPVARTGRLCCTILVPVLLLAS
jgi:hypothetical protein